MTINKILLKQGYKKTAVGIIPEDWEVKRLEDISTIKNGRSYSHLENGDIPVYASGGIINYVNDYLYDGVSVGIGRKGTIDKPQLLTGKYWVVDTLFYINNFKEVLPYFLYSKFQQVNWYRYNETSGLPSLIKNTIEKIPFSFPPLHEQKAIADCLSTWDKAIEKQIQLIEFKKEFKKGLMQGFFNGSLTVKDGKVIKAKEGEDFTEDWEEIMLRDVIKVQGGYAFKSSKFKEFGIPVIRISNLDDKLNIITFDDIVYYDKISNKQFKVAKGDMMIAMSGATTGKTAIYTKDDIAYLNQRVGLFKNKDENIFHYPLLYFLVKTEEFENEIKKLLSTGAQPNISSSEIESVKIKIPTIEFQIAIAQVLQSADKEIGLLEQKLSALEKQKKGLMQVLLTGEKRLV